MSSSIDWLVSKDSIANDNRVVDLAYAKQHFEVRELCPDGWLILNRNDGFWLKFAVVQFHCSYDEGGQEVTEVEPVFYGEGPSEGLRECRHTWWGENGGGYIFYPKAKVIKAGLDALSEFYDLS